MQNTIPIVKPITLTLVKTDCSLLLWRSNVKTDTLYRGFSNDINSATGGRVTMLEARLSAKISAREEIGIEPVDINEVGILLHNFSGTKKFETHVFVVDKFEGFPRPKKGCVYKWFWASEIKYRKSVEMMPDYYHWMHFVFEGKRFTGHFFYDDECELKTYSVEEA